MKRALVISLLVGLWLISTAGAYFLGRGGASVPGSGAGSPGQTGAASRASEIYTCSMHPQVRLGGPGDCPICEMPLTRLGSSEGGSGEAPSLQLSEHALAMASIETTPVVRRQLSRELRAVGRIEYNESSLATITARVDGYAERLFVNFTGVEIRKGDHLAEVYSPELLVAEQELLIALQSGVDGALVEVAKTKLRLLGMTDSQIEVLTNRKEAADRVTLYSPISGTVIEKGIVEKAAFKAGEALYRIANLDSVWVYLEIYEYDLPWVRYGQRVTLTAEAVPGRAFQGRVTFVQPIVDEASRTIRIPVHIENPDHVLKPGMFVTAAIDAILTSEGTAAPTGIEGKHSCPMHPQVLEESDGACPICEMPLEQIPGGSPEAPGEAGAAGSVAPPEPAPPAPRYICPMKCTGETAALAPGRCPVCKMRLEVAPPEPVDDPSAGALAVPVLAVLDSGTRRLVYVERSRGLFEPREVTLGPRSGEHYPVIAGLSAGERVATRGGFLIDSQFQVTGHASLFYPGGLQPSAPHERGANPPAAPRAQESQTPTAPAGGQEHKH